jgi:hypothetical protein
MRVWPCCGLSSPLLSSSEPSSGDVHRGGGEDPGRDPGGSGVPAGMCCWAQAHPFVITKLAFVWRSTASRGNPEAQLEIPFTVHSCSRGHPEPPQTRPSIPLLPQQIDELLAGNFTQEDEDAILEELNAITQVQSPGLSCPLGDGTLWASAWWCVPLLCLSPESWFPDSLPTVIPLYGSQAASTLRAALRDLCRSGLESDPAVCCWPALVTHVWTERKC